MDGTLNQPYILAATMYAGMIAGIVYSVFKAFRKLLSGGKAFLIAADILFVVILFVLTVLTMYFASNMKIRPYNFIGVAIGFALYNVAIAPLSKKIGKLLFKNRGKDTNHIDKRPQKSSNMSR